MDREYWVDLDQIPKWALKTRVEPVEGEISGFTCRGCGHTWHNRTDEPTSCPECGARIVWDDDPESRLLSQADIDDLTGSDSDGDSEESVKLADILNHTKDD